MDGASKRADRFKWAGLGLGITLAPVAALALAQFLWAPHIVASVGGMDPKIDTWAVSSFRSALAEGYTVVAAIIFAYWLITATLCRGQFLKVRSANVALVLSGLIFALAMTIASTMPTPGRLFKASCPVFGFPDTMAALPSGKFGFDGQTPCEAFASGAAPIVLLGLPLILFVTSAILRVIVSRRR